VDYLTMMGWPTEHFPVALFDSGERGSYMTMAASFFRMELSKVTNAHVCMILMKTVCGRKKSLDLSVIIRDFYCCGYYFQDFTFQLKRTYGEEQVVQQLARFFVLSYFYPKVNHDFIGHFLMLTSLDQRLNGVSLTDSSYWNVFANVWTVCVTQKQRIADAFFSPLSDIVSDIVSDAVSETSLSSSTLSTWEEEATHKQFLQFSSHYPSNSLTQQLRRISLLDFVTARNEIQSVLYHSWWEVQLFLYGKKEST
jgi:hypothetical protein